MNTESEHNDATVNTLEVGGKIKILRINQKRTLQEVADNCGLSKSMISKIENNKTVPSVAALVKIAQTLGTNISNLFEQDGWANAIITTREEAEKKFVLTEKGYSIFPYASEFHEKKCSPFYLKHEKEKWFRICCRMKAKSSFSSWKVL